ncbi:MAG: helix-hairpin-helix domain-containing protein [Promethearchaeota archaeon]
MEKTEDASIKPQAIVKSPSREALLRKGSGFSLGEIKAAAKSIQMIRTLGIKIDFERKSVHQSNIEQLKKIKVPVRKEKKRPPFIRKEKKVRVRTKKVKKKTKPVEKVKVPAQKPVKVAKIPKQKVKQPSKAKRIPKIKIKEKPIEKEELVPIIEEKLDEKEKPKKKEIVKEEKIGTPLTELSGLGKATVKKFNEVGVNTVEDLIKEIPEELSMIISGVSEERIKKWINEGKDLLKK